MNNRQQMLVLDGAKRETWKFTVDTEATAAGEKTTGIPLNLYGQNNVIMKVDWGDGTTSTLTSADYASNDSRASVHEYETAGVYQVTMKSVHWSSAYLHSVNGTTSFTSSNNTRVNLYWWKRTVVSIDSIFPRMKGIYLGTASDATYGSGTSFNYFFYGCKKLLSIPEGLFDSNTAATSFYGCFQNCSSLQSIPSGLFDKNTAVTSFSSCFSGCSSLQSIPAGLFDNNTEVTDFRYCFSNCSSIQSIPEGLFDSNTAVTNFSYCFYYCPSLQSIPSGLFDKNTVVTTFASCFYYCPSLQSIPSGLFDSNMAATDFNYCFYGCSSFQSIPPGLFDSNTAVTNFYGCFQNCSSLQSIPSGLFDKNTAVTNFSYCFYSCSSLKNFKLIIGSPLVTTFSSFVSNASNVTRIVCVPDGSTTYTTLFSYANTSNNITVSAHNLDCVQTLEYTVDTTAANAKTAAIPLAAVQNASSKLLIDWGDGNGVELTPEQVTTSNLTHTYSNAGNYQITVGTINWLDYQFLADSNATSSNALIQTFRDTVVSIDEKIPPVANNTNLDYWFYNCTHLNCSFNHIFDNLPNATSAVATFKNCTSLAVISAGTLRKQEALTNATEMFAGCTEITYVPSGLLSQCRQLTNISSIFNGCTSLATIPNTLLLNNTAITTQTNAFTGCVNSSPTFLTKTQFETAGIHVELFDTEVSETGGSKVGIPYNLSIQDQTSTQLTVDWGDATIQTLTASDYTNYVSASSIHEYSNKGLYFVSILSNDWSHTYPGVYNPIQFTAKLTDSTVGTGTECVYYRNQTLIEVATKLPAIPKLIGLVDGGSIGYMSNSCRSYYRECSKLKIIPSDLFVNNASSTNIAECFAFCASLQSIPSGLLNNNTAATDFYGCFFGCTSLQSIPSGLFDSNTAVTSFTSCFQNCTSLQSIPSGLFDSNMAVTSFSACFYGCSSLQSIPSGLFNNNTAVTSFYQCFYNCSSLQSIPSGLFDNITAVTDFTYCFAYCSSIQSIPSGLFDSNIAATYFSNCFSNCRSLQSIPSGLFDSNTAVTDFSYCFSNCRSLQSIPSGLFDSNTAVTDFEYCFGSCTSLQSIPSGLFDSNTAVTDFGNCFYACTSLQSIPSGLFDSNTTVTSFYGCFEGCTSFQSIPEGLFDNNTAVTSFGYCFRGCTSLQSVPSGLFDSNTAVTTFLYCFYNCTSLNDFTLYIGSSSVSSCSSFVTKKAGATRIVYVPADSTTYTTFSNAATTLGLTVNPIEYVDITLESSSDEKSYDGTALTGGTVTLSSGSLAEGDSFTYQMTGRQELIGSSENTFTYSISSVSGTNYRVTCEYGILTVTDGTNDGEEPIDDTLIVEMTAEGQEGSESEIQYSFGDEVIFEISVKNPYEDAQTITLTEIEDVTLAQSTFENVAGGQYVSTTAIYAVTEADIIQGSFTNTVTASIGNLEKTAECTILTEDIDATLICNIKIANEPANSEAYVLGERINYEIDVTNDGNVTYNNVQVLCEDGGMSETIYSLHSGETETFETSHIVDESDITRGSFTATATVEGDELEDGTVPMADDNVTTGDEDDPDGPNYPIEASNPSIAVSIDYINPPSNGTSYAVDEDVEYGLELTNNGNLTITDIELDDETSESIGTAEEMYPERSIQFSNHSCHITQTNIADGYFTIQGLVTGTSPDENNPDYSDTFTFQIPITPE